MKRKLLIAAAVPLCVLLLSGCQCKHEWVEANCTTAKICSECGETEGEPLGHEPGNWIVRRDIVNAEKYKERFCKSCGILLETLEQERMTSFVKDKEFAFSPREFLERFSHFAKESLEDFQYAIETGPNGKSIVVQLDFESAKEYDYMMTFCNRSGEVLGEKDLDTVGVWYVSLGVGVAVDSTLEYGILLDPDLMLSFYKTCDPIFSEEDYQEQVLMQFTCYLNWVEYGEFAGYSELNELYYEFSNFLYSEESVDSAYFVQQIGVYPFNFMN